MNLIHNTIAIFGILCAGAILGFFIAAILTIGSEDRGGTMIDTVDANLIARARRHSRLGVLGIDTRELLNELADRLTALAQTKERLNISVKRAHEILEEEHEILGVSGKKIAELTQRARAAETLVQELKD